MIRFFRTLFLVPFCQCGHGVHVADHRNSVVRSARYVHAQRAFFCFGVVQPVQGVVRKVKMTAAYNLLNLLDFVLVLCRFCSRSVEVLKPAQGGI